MTQLALDWTVVKVEALELAEPPPCMFGESGIGWLGPHHCGACLLESVRLEIVFWQGVARGDYDAHGRKARR